MTNFFCVICRTPKEYLCIFEGNTMCNTCLDITQNDRKKQQKRSVPKPNLSQIINIVHKNRAKGINNYARAAPRHLNCETLLLCMSFDNIATCSCDFNCEICRFRFNGVKKYPIHSHINSIVSRTLKCIWYSNNTF